MSILENIRSHQDLVGLTPRDRAVLCREIREFLISQVSQTGGHVASNLGVVELTVAIETVFDTAKDRLVFDVGHQSYIHKMLTGRQADFAALRQFGGMAGFPKPSESVTDAFIAGHASSSVSIALGMARARTLQQEDYNVIALIGDGAATGGLAFEGLNDASVSGEPMIIILNDNAMSIDRNVGGMASHLRQVRTKVRYLGMKQHTKEFLSKVPGGNKISRFLRITKDKVRRLLLSETIFESMGFTYLGPVDGHDTEKLIFLLQSARDMNRPVVLHVTTEKGRGYAPAEEHPKLFHGIGKFNPVTGEPLSGSAPSFSQTFGGTMVELAKKNKNLCAITAAMPGGTGLLDFKKTYPNRLFDVGIAEGHAVSMAGGLAKQGVIPVVALYSTFLQRAYDMVLQDICMLNLHVVLAVDRAGLVGEDGETHHGIYDVGFLRQAPGLRILTPASRQELKKMLTWAVEEQNGPVAIRYPRGGDGSYTVDEWDSSRSAIIHRQGKDGAIVTYGTLVNNVLAAANILAEQGIDISVIRITDLSSVGFDDLKNALAGISTIVFAEEASSGIYNAVASQLAEKHSFTCVDLGKEYVPHGSVAQLYEKYGLDAVSLAEKMKEVLGK